MYIDARNPEEAFLSLTRNMLSLRRDYGVMVRFPMGGESKHVQRLFDEAFDGKTEIHHGEKLIWRDYLTSAVFPWHYYKENCESLARMAQDKRLWGVPSYRGKNVTNNFFGRLCRPINNGKSYLQYLLERFSDKTHRAMPHFYFDLYDPAWVWEDLMRNPNIIKTGRSACTCAMNMAFRWDAVRECPVVYLIVKHCNWSHAYGDVFGCNMIAHALCKELGFENADVVWFSVSISMDEPKAAKHIVDNY